MTNKEAIEQIDSLIDNSESFKTEEGDIWDKDIEALNIAKKAIEKQIPKKPKSVERHLFECPCCKDDLGVSEDDIFIYGIPTPMYCSNCGQALDWSDTE